MMDDDICDIIIHYIGKFMMEGAIMKKRILSLLLVVSLIMTSGITAFATEPEVQASLDAYEAVKATMANKDLAGLQSAIAEFEKANEALTEEQDEELSDIIGEELFDVVFSAALVIGMAELKDAFVADKNANTALMYADSYKLYVVEEDWGKEDAELIKGMLPDGQSVYEEALTYLPAENVMKVYYAYADLSIAILFQCYDEDYIAAYKGFEEVLDIYEELTSEELNQLAALLEEENGKTVSELIDYDWMTATAAYEMGKAYEAFMNDANEETAKAYVDCYRSIFSRAEYDDEVLQDCIGSFFIDSYDVYIEALALAGEDSDADTEDGNTEVEVEEDKNASPKTGDTASVIWPLAVMFAATAVFVTTKKRRA